MNNIIVLKDHSCFKYVHGNRFPGQSKDKVFIFKMSVDILESGVDVVSSMQIRGYMENL